MTAPGFVAVMGASRSGHNWTSRMIRSWIPDTPFHQFENLKPIEWASTKRGQVLRRGVRDNGVVLIQVRDYLNFAASWFKHLTNMGQTYRASKSFAIADTWHQLSMEAFGDTNYITDEKHPLIYDHFVVDQGYRRQICEWASGQYDEFQLNIIPSNGHYSSFDGSDYQGMGSRMKVCDRWRYFLTREGSHFLDAISARKDILEYYMEKFDPPPEKLEFIDNLR